MFIHLRPLGVILMVSLKEQYSHISEVAVKLLLHPNQVRTMKEDSIIVKNFFMDGCEIGIQFAQYWKCSSVALQKRYKSLTSTIHSHSIAMEILMGTELTIPLGHMLLFILLSALCLLFARYKMGLAITFSFTFYWGFIYNKEIIYSQFSGSSAFLFLYFFSGLVLLMFALCSLVLHD